MEMATDGYGTSVARVHSGEVGCEDECVMEVEGHVIEVVVDAGDQVVKEVAHAQQDEVVLLLGVGLPETRRVGYRMLAYGILNKM